MNKLPILYLILCLCFTFVWSPLQGQSQTERIEAFHSLILEIQDREAVPTAKLIDYRVHNQRLKRESVSELNSEKNESLLQVQFLSEEGKVVRSFEYADPFYSDYEFQNEEEQLEHVNIKESKKTFHLRFAFDPSIAQIEVISRKGTESTQLIKQSLND